MMENNSDTRLERGGASPLYLQLRRRLRTLIQEGQWDPAAQLPAVPELARQWGVHRLTVLKAIDGLKRTGWVQTVQGRGSFVAPSLPQVPSPQALGEVPFEGQALTIPVVPWSLEA